LQGEEDPSARPAAELGDQLKAAQKLADLGESGGGPFSVHQALAVEEELELGPPPGEPIHDFRRNDLEACFMTETYFFVDQSQGRLGAQVGMAVEKCLGCRALATLPRRHHFFHELRCQRKGAATRKPASLRANEALCGLESREPGRIACQIVEARRHIMGHLL
jgi:hypothetical protein